MALHLLTLPFLERKETFVNVHAKEETTAICDYHIS